MKLYVASLAGLLLAFGCASENKQFVLDPVGPAPSAVHPRNADGSLVVYTAFDVHANFTGGYPDHRRFTDYRVLTTDGKLLQTVHNDGGNVSQAPITVALAPGKYQVIARASRYGTVTVPVVIAPNECTTVHLDGISTAATGTLKTNEVVRLPNGQVVGWRDSSSEKLAETASPVATSK